MTLTALALLALAVQSPSGDSLRVLARTLPEAALVREAREAPLSAREGVSTSLRAGDLTTARKLASAYAVAWQDEFLAREVSRFASWSPDQRQAALKADSLRRAGVAAYGREGAGEAIAIWRRALARALTIGDTALAGAVAGNLGAAFAQTQLDSAEIYLARAVELARAVGDLRVEANAVTATGVVSEARGDLAGARQHYTVALDLHERLGDARGLAADRNNLGLLAWTAGDLTEARRHFEAALDLNRLAGREEVAATNRVNLAGLASLRGDFESARQLYHEALATWRMRDEWASAADALHGLGQLELRRGDYAAAREALDQALAIYEQTGPLASELLMRRLLASTMAAQGELQEALDALRQADELAVSRDAAPGVKAGIVLTRADLSVQLNALAEAEQLYGRAELLFRDAGNADGQAEAQHGRGLLRLERDDYEGAETMFLAALRVQQGGGNERAAGLTLVALGGGARARGDTALARTYLDRAMESLERAGDPVSLAVALGEQAALESDRYLPASAAALYGQALDRIEGYVAPDVAWRLHAGLAQAREARGDTDGAAKELRLAVAEVERAGRSLVLPERRAGFLADKWDVYAQLSLLEQSRGFPGSAFEVSESLRARETLELLERGRIGWSPDAPDALVTREQDLRRHITGLTNQLEGVSSGSLRGPSPVDEVGTVREALLDAQRAYADLLLEVREQAPQHAELVSRETAGWRDVAARLATGEVLIEYLVSDSSSVAFVVARDSLVMLDLGIGRRDLARLVAFARGTVEAPQPATDSLWHGPFRRLDRHLIAPVEETGLLAGATRLVLVPHAELHYLPFAALLSDEGTLIERYELATTPSATVWLELGDRHAEHRGSGVLAMAPRTDVLPASRSEVEAVARFGGDGTQALTGAAATESAFLGAVPGKSIVHLATYGVLNKHNPLFSFVELSPDSAQDGRLEVHEVFGLTLSADLIVLSACQTGLGSGRIADVPSGDDWVGLTRAFLHAGARSVVATLWAVEDGATAVLMERFYEELGRGSEPARALAGAQSALLGDPTTAHPFYWAGVVLAEGSGR